ncbi:ATP-binding protein [Spirillospora sp. NPDC048819]|uniref:sensor histidine kinase n=1 Tax=Spirillospora sp. NPDC048819 TaxID=3155268 RepID=UPI0033FF5988
MRDALMQMEITDVAGVFAVRQAGRQVAAAMHLAHHDQIRVAIALSELGRELFSRFGRVSAAFLLERDGDPRLVIEFGFEPPPGADIAGDGFSAAARLMDLVEEDGRGDLFLVRARKNLPAGVAGITGAELEELRTRLWRLLPVPALEELRTQNTELIDALEEARRQREELRRLNAELEETNQGVMALYTELSEELDKTNRGVVALYADLDEKTDQLREVGEAKNRFWASISHELRTPVNSIIGLARLLLDPAADSLSEEQRRQISLIDDTGRTLLGLVNELLDMAKAEQGRLEAQPSAVDTHALVDKLSALMAPMAEQTDSTLTVDADGAPPVLVTDEVMLTRLLRNLLGNGLKFTDEGEVRLTVRSTAEHVEFVVTDTGRGIPHAELERVFEEFYQVPGPRTEGTGLGLPYSRRLALLLGGELTLESTLGEGTTATLRLPSRPPPAEPRHDGEADPGGRGDVPPPATGPGGHGTERESSRSGRSEGDAAAG